mmetsp:Transcript_4338/g.9715  ORF Transcript_4338/g.9715 Transcript_4338/m.9715 type:complete len:308 (-) Transcript_4338:119-1042(-)
MAHQINSTASFARRLVNNSIIRRVCVAGWLVAYYIISVNQNIAGYDGPETMPANMLAKPPSPLNHHRVPEIHFRTYADHKYAKSRERIVREANETGWFTTVRGLGPEDLSETFQKRFDDILVLPRGGGYWVWKYDVIEQALQTMEEGDFLVYLDAGCKVNKQGEDRFWEYIKMVKESSFDMICVQLTWPEHIFTTQRVFDAFNVTRNNIGITQTGQFEGGTLLMQKGPHLSDWLSKVSDVLVRDPWLITDKYNNEAKTVDTQFKDNRHDQSISSVSRKQLGCIVVDGSETWGDSLDDKPFQALRLKE